jgi:hypothetical protein
LCCCCLQAPDAPKDAAAAPEAADKPAAAEGDAAAKTAEGAAVEKVAEKKPEDDKAAVADGKVRGSSVQLCAQCVFAH